MFAACSLVLFSLLAPLASLANHPNPVEYYKPHTGYDVSNQYQRDQVQPYGGRHPHYYYKPEYYTDEKRYQQPGDYYGYPTHHRKQEDKVVIKYINQCNTGPVQCCNTVQHSGSPHSKDILQQFGLSNIQGFFATSCTPVLTGALASQSCTSQPVCCSNNTFEGVIAIGCTPVNNFGLF